MIRRLEPLWWLLFGGGGMATAMAMTMLFFIVAVAYPLGIGGSAEETYFRMKMIFANPVGKGVLIAVIALPFWNGAHHLRHFTIDMGFPHQATRVGTLLYAGALLGTLATVAIVGSL
jgi:fumarate reductase subunit D